MSLLEKFRDLVESSAASVAYWRDVAITDFSRDLQARIAARKVTHADLANLMGVSRPHVTKLLSGGNYTLDTMVRLSMALGGVLRVHIADADSITHWIDGLRSEVPAAQQAMVTGAEVNHFEKQWLSSKRERPSLLSNSSTPNENIPLIA